MTDSKEMLLSKVEDLVPSPYRVRRKSGGGGGRYRIGGVGRGGHEEGGTGLPCGGQVGRPGMAAGAAEGGRLRVAMDQGKRAQRLPTTGEMRCR